MTTTSARRGQILESLQDKTYRDAFVEAEINTTLPFQIRAMRAIRGWSQTELARHTRQAQKTISDFENPSYGRLTLTSLKKLASAFDVALVVRFVPFSELVGWTLFASKERMEVQSFAEDIKKGGRHDVVKDGVTTVNQMISYATYVEAPVVIYSAREAVENAVLGYQTIKVDPTPQADTHLSAVA